MADEKQYSFLSKLTKGHNDIDNSTSVMSQIIEELKKVPFDPEMLSDDIKEELRLEKELYNKSLRSNVDRYIKLESKKEISLFGFYVLFKFLMYTLIEKDNKTCFLVLDEPMRLVLQEDLHRGRSTIFDCINLFMEVDAFRKITKGFYCIDEELSHIILKLNKKNIKNVQFLSKKDMYWDQVHNLIQDTDQEYLFSIILERQYVRRYYFDRYEKLMEIMMWSVFEEISDYTELAYQKKREQKKSFIINFLSDVNIIRFNSDNEYKDEILHKYHLKKGFKLLIHLFLTKD